MKSHAAKIVIGFLVVVCFGLVFSAVYPFTTSTSYAANPPSERFTVSDTDAYSAKGSIVVDGQVRLAFDSVVTADGAWYQRVVDGDVVSEAYQPTASGTVYHRLTVGNDDATQRRELITEDEDRVLVREDWDEDRVTFIAEANTTSDARQVSGTASVFVNSLSLARYEAEETDSSGETVYEPQSGWYDGREAYRLTDAAGEVHADADTHVVKSANVSWDVTEPAGTYAEYALVRFASDEPTAYRITFEFDSDNTTLERPAWVNDTNSA
ncbi:hypothetical protein [Haloferax larsenii]|uniref:Uncharacterized protein n=1 Tax=Haloferax larsenii TaxID=302484 RepID=A0A1H7TAB7_HALLR|nr:hypothetical protein [Haloferax larsenii]SEL80777.1 hypothetical protein SAMN04488691_108104 [Haloferax larsenii]